MKTCTDCNQVEYLNGREPYCKMLEDYTNAIAPKCIEYKSALSIVLKDNEKLSRDMKTADDMRSYYKNEAEKARNERNIANSKIDELKDIIAKLHALGIKL